MSTFFNTYCWPHLSIWENVFFLEKSSSPFLIFFGFSGSLFCWLEDFIGNYHWIFPNRMLLSHFFALSSKSKSSFVIIFSIFKSNEMIFAHYLYISCLEQRWYFDKCWYPGTPMKPIHHLKFWSITALVIILMDFRLDIKNREPKTAFENSLGMQTRAWFGLWVNFILRSPYFKM